MQPGIWQGITKPVTLLNCKDISVCRYKSSEKEIKSGWFIGAYKAVKKGEKEEAKKIPTKQKYFGKCLLTSDAEA